MAEVAGSNPAEPILIINDGIIREHLDILRLKGVTEKHIKEVNRTLKSYQKYILSRVDKQKSIRFFKKLQQNYSTSYYRKRMYQLIRFLNSLNVDWINEIELPKEPEYKVKIISKNDLIKTIEYFNDNIQMKSLVLLGASSGLRAQELYQLTIEDIDLEHRTVYIKHDPYTQKTTKTRKSRVSFFNEYAKNQLYNYLKTKPMRLFAQKTCYRAFHNAPIRVKDLRKYFSQEWDRRGGPTSIKKILMGHSLKGDVDLMHYNAQSEEDLKKIYDNVMNDLSLH